MASVNTRAPRGASDPLIGSEIDGYLVEALLGHGGMARVYRGYDINLNRFVALKVIDPRRGDDFEYNRRFRKEAQAIAQLRHQHIVGVYRFGEVGGMYYMAMDYIDGPDLAALLRGYKANGELMPYDDVYKVIAEVGKALDYAHKRGIIHRDIKPSNIMVNSNNEAILTDFGLALVTAEGTTGDVFGSPFYIAPEQAMSSGSVVPQTDIYSLGVTLYEMLTGFVPFSQGEPMQIVMSHMTEAPPPPQDYFPHLHRAFNPVLERALDKDPAKRYASCQKLVTALRAAIRAVEEDRDSTGRLAVRAAPAGDSSLRLSTARLPEKVNALRRANPLPPAPHMPRQENAPTTPAPLDLPPNAADRSVVATAAPRARRGRGLLLLVLLLIFAAGGAYAAVQSGLLPLGGSNPVTIRVEGVVRAIDGERLTIYDQVFLVSPDAVDAVRAVEVGDHVVLEGAYTMIGATVRFDSVTARVGDDGGD